MGYALSPCPVQRWWTASGIPAVGYTFNYFEPNSDTAKDIYSDIAGTPFPSPSNVMTLNAEGYGIVYLGGAYKLVIKDTNGSTVLTIPYIEAGGSFGGVGAAMVDTIIATDDPATNGLQQVDPSLYTLVYCAGYNTPQDGGGGWFYVKTSSTATDGGYAFKNSIDSSFTAFRISNPSDAVKAPYFGCICDASADRTSQLLAADAYAAANSKTLTLENTGGVTELLLTGTVELTSKKVQATSYVKFMPVTDGTTLIFDGIFDGPQQFIFGVNPTFLSQAQRACPEWFGGVGGGADSTDAFNSMFISGAKKFFYPASVANGYTLGGTLVLPGDADSIYMGVINLGANLEISFTGSACCIKNTTFNSSASGYLISFSGTGGTITTRDCFFDMIGPGANAKIISVLNGVIWNSYDDEIELLSDGSSGDIVVYAKGAIANLINTFFNVTVADGAAYGVYADTGGIINVLNPNYSSGAYSTAFQGFTDTGVVNIPVMAANGSIIGDVIATGSITAEGGLKEAIISGGTNYRVPCSVYTTTTGVNNSGSTETTLMSFTNTTDGTTGDGILNVNGDKLELVAFGDTAANTNVKRFRMYMGSSLIFDTDTIHGGTGWVADGVQWKIECTYIRHIAFEGRTLWKLTLGGIGPLPAVSTFGTFIVGNTINTVLGADPVFKLTVTCVDDNDCTLQAGYINWIPNN